MKQSGYRTTFHIYLIFFLSLLGTLIAVCCLFAMLITATNPNGKNVRSDQPKIFTQDFSKYIVFVNDTPKIKQTGLELLQETHVGLQILDAAGNEVYAYQKPNNAQDYYSNTDLLQLYQTGHFDNASPEDMTAFIGVITGNEKDYAYVLYFPMNIQKVTMYLNGERFAGGKKVIIFIIGILLVIVLFLGLGYGLLVTKAISRLSASIRDISGRCYLPAKEKGAFRDLIKSLNELDGEVRASDRLREKTENLRREWISNITHDLKTPLSPIKGYAEILCDDTEKTIPQCKRYAEVMLKNAAYMENLIDDLKLTWQLENDMLPINRQEQNIVRFLRELSIDILNRPEYEERTIAFQCSENITDETAIFSFDKKLFTRTFQNLIINAFVHGGKDTEVTVQISVSDCWLNINLSDNGIGMSAEETDQLFDRYYRGTNTESKSEGTGLGLAIAKSIIELHGGTISVTSSPGAGTAFLIRFPGI